MRGELPKGLDGVIDAYKRELAEKAPEIATRKAGEAALNVIAPAVPELVTGSADLTPSNNTKVAATREITPDDFSGRYIHWGIREHGMAAACNGIAVHGGFIPSGASFLAFTDYSPARAAHRRADEDPGRARLHPRLDRARRGRSDPSAGRADRVAAGDAEHVPLAAGRQRRDGRVLAGGARASRIRRRSSR